MFGCVPGPCSRAAAPALCLTESPQVSSPVQFHPPLRALLRKAQGATQSFGEKLTPGSSCDCSSPGLQVGWLGRKPAACLFLEFLSLFWGTCALVSLLKTDLSQCSGSSCGRAQGSSFSPCLLFAGLRSEVSFSPWQSQHSLPACHKRRTHCVGICGHVACVLYA